MNILFVCSRNQWRSPTAEAIFKKHPNHQVRSAGTEPAARIRISAKLIEWADYIFVMEKRHKQRLLDKYRQELRDKPLVVLDIPDDYGFMDEELIDMITSSMKPYLLSMNNENDALE